MTIYPVPTFSTGEGLGENSRKAFEEHGSIVVGNVFPTEEMTELGETFVKKVEEDNTFAVMDYHIDKNDMLGKYPRFVQPHRWPDTPPGASAKRLMLDNRLVDISSNLIGPLLVAQSMFQFKPPTARGQAMHQDDFFLGTLPGPCLAAWVAVNDADAENGAIEVVPGSHHYDITCHEQADMFVSYAARAMPLPPNTPTVMACLKAGDVSFFNGHVVHGSKPNGTKDRFRRALIYHYVPERCERIHDFFQPLVKPSGEEVYVSKDLGEGGSGADAEIDRTRA